MRRVERQAAVLNELRNRASIVLTATGVIASLLGAEVLGREDPFPWAFLPLVALGAGLLSCVAVLLPVRDETPKDPTAQLTQLTGLGRIRALVRRRDTDPREWQVTIRGTRLRQLAASGDATAFREAIVAEFEGCLSANYLTIRFRSRFLNLACLLVPAQIFLWMLVLWRVPLAGAP